MNRCIGCGSVLQSLNKDEVGYISKPDKVLCERCFKIKNYGEYIPVIKKHEEFENMLKEISKTKDLVVLVIDLFNFNPNNSEFEKYIDNDVILVLTKRDLLPKSLYEEKLLNYLDGVKLNIVDKVIISSFKNYNFDYLIETINNHKKSKNVYVLGYTNAGKSTMINKIIYNYSKYSNEITTSILPNTTIDNVLVPVNDDLILIDTPGILDNGSIYYLKDIKELKKIIPNKAINPIGYQINKKQSILVEDLFKLDLANNNIVIYVSNRLKVDRVYKDIKVDMDTHEIDIKSGEDVVISGVGFVKFTKDEHITLHTIKGINVYTRKSLI